ncbi:MAG: 3'(2'),5'-bisphosphate nucleotidase CysQ, partial [Actinomycetota bacterium]|nr:3'(2'),5'-bisphosphate nucleotidase CysQ [Actinomycetota bacterium]
MDLRERLHEPHVDVAALRHEADRRSNEFIIEELERLHPHDAILSEESADDRARVDRRRAWVVDPLDGTREFSEAGRVDWAVHVALVVDGIPAAGAVALPARGITLTTESPPIVRSSADGAP